MMRAVWVIGSCVLLCGPGCTRSAPAAPAELAAVAAPVPSRSADVADAGAEARAWSFAAPEPIEPPARPDRAPTCADRGSERLREQAALDAELRRRGGMVLPAQAGPTSLLRDGTPDPRLRPPGQVIDWRGRRVLVVSADGVACGRPLPLIGMDAEGAVFVILPEPRAQSTRRVRCRGCRAGCGARMPPRSIVVEVPDGAHLAPPRRITFPMELRVVFADERRVCPVP